MSRSSLASAHPAAPSYESYVARGYKHGSIVRVAMRNFLTYDNAEAFPGPHLNVVLGPNGSGKSALTHAICLACGGSPASIGRSDDITQFVKRGKASEGIAFCEVDVLAHESVRTVRRVIQSDSRTSKWFINGRTSSQAEVKHLMKTMNIDVDNICSFMPQDKVGSFTQLTPQGVLQKTLQSIEIEGTACAAFQSSTSNSSNSASSSSRSALSASSLHASGAPATPLTLYDEQMALAKFQSDARQRENELVVKRRNIEELQRRVQSMQADVDRMRQRGELQETRRLLLVKETVVEAEEAQTQLQTCIDRVNESTKALNEAKEAIKPLEVEERNLKRELAVKQKTLDGALNKTTSLNDEIREIYGYIEACGSGITVTMESLEGLDRSFDAAKQRLRTAQSELNRLTTLKAQAEDSVSGLQARLEEVGRSLKETEAEMHNIGESINSIDYEMRSLNETAARLQKRISSITDSRVAFLRKIPQKFQAAATASEWVRNNERRFRSPVYGPVGMHIRLEDDRIARMVEHFVPANRLMAFLVDNDEDFKLLDSELRRKQHLKIDIFTMKNAIIPPRPYDSRLMAEQGDRMGGSLRYLSDATPAPQCMPQLVMSYLCTFQAFHKAMYLTPSDRGSSVNLATLPPDSFRSLCRNEDQFQVYVVEGGSVITSYHGQKSRYASSEAPSLQTGDVRTHLNFLGVASGSADDSENRDDLERELQRVQADASKLDAKKSKLSETQQRMGHQYEALRRDRTSILSDIRAPAQYNQLIDNEKRKIIDIQKQLSRGSEVEKASFQRDLKGHIDKYTKGIGNLQSRIQSLDKLSVESRIVHSTIRELQSKHSSVAQQLRSRLGDVETFERAKEAAEEERNAAQENFETFERRLEDLQDESGGEAAFEKVYQRCILELPEKTLVQIRARIAEVSGLLERSIDNPQLLARYDSAKAELATETEALMQLDSSLRNAEESIQARSTAWLDTVTAIATKLHMLFSAFMEELQYAGAVTLVKKGMFDTYEMQMQVSYREEDGLFDLSGQRHSGGERAVATIMYLMALQTLTSAPFRVVDEINQGMDERNERLVFDRIVRSCCRTSTATASATANASAHAKAPSSRASSSSVSSSSFSSSSASHAGDASTPRQSKPQYFLVSPKLLPALRSMDNDDVTALMVWNGPGVTPWTLADVLTNLRKLKRHMHNAEDIDGSYSQEDVTTPTKRSRL